jgi:hypothetical protein
MKCAIGMALTVLLAAGATCAHEPDKDKDQPKQEEPKKQEPDKHAGQGQQKAHEHEPQQKSQQDEAKHQQEQQRDHQKKDEKGQADRNRETAKQQEQSSKQQQRADRDRVQQARHDNNNGQASPSQGDRAAHNGRRIRQEDFHAHFGRPHVFHVQRRDDHRFNYGGYWFQYQEAWPADWSYDDDVYIDEIDDEYYLIDPIHPGIRILVIIVD